MRTLDKTLTRVTLIAAIGAANANAADHRIWREQVAVPDGPPIELGYETVEPAKKRASDTLPWREQVRIVDNNRVFIPEAAGNRHGSLGDDLMWRERVRPRADEPETTAAK